MSSDWKRKFITIYAGQAFSLVGSAAVQFAVIWWLTVQTESATALELAALISSLPNLLAGPFAGVWIDRCNRRAVMIAADGLVASSSAALGLAFLWTASPAVWFVYLILFIRGLGNAFHAPAMQAAIPLFVPADMLMKAGDWGNLIVSVSTLAGPALGAWLTGAFPLAAVMLVDILGAAFAILCLLTVEIPDVPRQAAGLHVLEDLWDGLTAIRGNQSLRAAFLPVILATILYMPLASLFPLLARLHYLGGTWHNAVIQFMFSAGLLTTSLAMGLWGGIRRRFLMVSAAILVMGTAAAVSGGLPAAGFWGFAACCFVMGCSSALFNVPLVAHIQETVSPERMGKVFSVLSAAMTLSAPFGLLLAGPLSERVGVNRWFIWSGLLMGAIGALCFISTRPYDTRDTVDGPAV